MFPGISDGSNVGAAEAATSTPDQKPTGFYDLVAVLTHKGRSADSGHYVAWVKQESGEGCVGRWEDIAIGGRDLRHVIGKKRESGRYEKVEAFMGKMCRNVCCSSADADGV